MVQLLERGASLALLAGYAGEARQGEGRLVLVAGEAAGASHRSPRTPARPGPTSSAFARSSCTTTPGERVYCLPEGPDEDAIRKHHAALGVPCGEVHQVHSLT